MACRAYLTHECDEWSPQRGSNLRLRLSPVHADQQFFLDNFSLTSFICSCMCTAKNWQVFLDKEPCWKAGHASFSTRKLVRVYGRQGKIVRRTHEKINLSRNLSRRNCSSVRGFSVPDHFVRRSARSITVRCKCKQQWYCSDFRAKWTTWLYTRV